MSTPRATSARFESVTRSIREPRLSGRLASWLGLSIALLANGATARAGLLTIRPIDFGDGVTATGTITVQDGTSSIIDWNLVVTTTERLAHFTPGNTGSKAVSLVSVSADGTRMTVSPLDSGSGEGGLLFFRSPNPFLDVVVAVADFTGPNADTGQAFYLNGAAFDFLSPLTAPGQTEYLAATAGAGSSTFDLVPLLFSGGVTLTGTIRTDGTTGALTGADILSWDIVVDQVTEDLFTPANSSLSAIGLGLNVDGELAVDNPNGFLSFDKPLLGGRRHSLMLADFLPGDPFRGTAGYFLGRQAIYTVALGAPRGPWPVTGQGTIRAVPEPSTLPLALIGVPALTVLLYCRRLGRTRIRQSGQSNRNTGFARTRCGCPTLMATFRPLEPGHRVPHASA